MKTISPPRAAKSSFRILYLEDDRNDVELVRAKLEEEGLACSMIPVETEADFITALNNYGFDVILADYKLPSFDGLAALSIARKKAPDVPFIFVSGSMGEELAIDTLKRGATDYVLKQRLSRLGPAIRRALEEAEEHLERRKAEEEVKKYQEHLEEMVKERTAQLNLTNEQLEQEIADRKRMEEILLESEARYRIVADNTYDWEFWLNPDGKFLYCSPSCKRITGCDAEEFMSDPDLLDRIIHPDDRSVFLKHIHEVGEKAVSDEIEFRIVRPDGSYRWIGHICQPVFDKGGLFLGRRGSNRDVTKRKRAEDGLKKISDELVRSNADLQQFAYAASHDLQEPLRVIEGFIKLLAKRYEKKLDAKAEEFIGFAIEGVKGMRALIKDLLDYSRVGTRDINLRPTDFSEAVDRAVFNLKEAVEESGAVITHDPLPTIRADIMQMSRLFQNLIGNAIKFRGKKTPDIHISAERNENGWTFSVRDNGIGIDTENAERIFAVFQRLHTREEYPGTGIGLAVCKRIVERHGGKIWVKSKEGKGSTFCFTIPDAR